MALPNTEFEADNTNVLPGENVRFSDLSTGNPIEWEWTFEGGSPSSSSNQNPTVRYSTEGVFDVTLVATNLGGSDTLIKEGYIVVGSVGVGDKNDDSKVVLFPNPGNGIFIIQFTDIHSNEIRIEVSDNVGNTIKRETITMGTNEFILDLHLHDEGLYIVNIYDGENHISKK